MINAVKALRLLPDADKEVLCHWLSIGYGHAQRHLQELSIFHQNAIWDEKDTYNFAKFLGGEIYYAGFYPRTNLGIFFDGERKLFYGSRFYLSELAGFIRSIDSCLLHLQRVDITKAIELDNPIVSIQKWFFTYGHFKDEAYSLGDFFYRMKLDQGHMALLDYPTDDHLDTDTFKFNRNYRKIDRLIFGDRSVNAYDYKDSPLKIKELTLIGNGFNAAVFHSFPVPIRDRIRREVRNDAAPMGPDRIFLTRSKSYRDVGNKLEVEAYFASAGFTIVNPESVTYEELVRMTQNAAMAAMYYGSALTNLVYFNENTKIFILKSDSYAEENISLWQKVISNYKLDVVEVPAEDNIISAERLQQLNIALVPGM